MAGVADGSSSSPERIEAAGAGAHFPATVASQDRLAFVRERLDQDVYSVGPGRPPKPLLTSSFADIQPQFSPDGRRIAFSSARAAESLEIWIAGADGKDAHQLTRGPGSSQSEPHWSPDGRWVVFESLSADGHWHLWIMEANGGAPRRLTTDSGNQNVPSWSRDGKWIYYSADDATGQREMWRIAVDGKEKRQITHGGSGSIGCESPDGESVLYKQNDGEGPLFVRGAGGRSAAPGACLVFAAGGLHDRGSGHLLCGL